MSDRFSCLSLHQLLGWIQREEPTGKIFGISEGLFFRPSADDPFRLYRYGRLLETPFGVAAGPHTQLSQNIVSAWLTGARYIELKTVQVLDELEVSKPCISMDDEGYNCEWSQELRLHQSLDEYLNALIAIHLLKKLLHLGDDKEPGFLFNMSVGYNLEGILSSGVQTFLNSMADAGERLEEKLAVAAQIFPEAADLDINPCVSDNITISTMHGCPPEEIEKIGRYFIEERKLNTTIKLNPTLLGPQELREILNNRLGFDITVPDIAFEHDLKWEAGVELIRNLQLQAEESGVDFNLKLTNTLETANDRNRLPEHEQMVYMSGRPLHVISTNLAAKLQKEFNGKLDISFSAGSDCFNMADVLRCGLQPVTVCSDLLKPGGYGRISQYLTLTEQAIEAAACSSLETFIAGNGGEGTALANLLDYAERVKDEPRYHKDAYPWQSIKTERELGLFDCIQAPCKGTCPTGQDVPAYMYYTAKGMFREALEAILRTNPFPHMQGLVCDHPCTDKCTRINYEEPLKIREIKRFVAQQCGGEVELRPGMSNGLKAAVIGGGPSGFSTAYFLRLNGFDVDLFEAKLFGGGMAADAIPSFRLDDDSIKKDIDRIVALGVKVHYGSPIGQEQFDTIRSAYDYVYIGVGAAEPYRLDIPGADGAGVYDQLDFLSRIRRGEELETGKTIAVIGGGNSAMDAARTAKRLVGSDGHVVIIYRRGIQQMPADREEIEAVLSENIEIREMVNPKQLPLENGRVVGVECLEMELGPPDESGRPRPVPRKGSEFTVAVDCVISAIGQKVVVPFVPDGLKVDAKTYATQLDKVYAGGDAIRGASTLIRAIGDGRIAVQAILADAALNGSALSAGTVEEPDPALLERKLSMRQYSSDFFAQKQPESLDFELVHFPMTREVAMAEASRCLSCDTLCNICTTVCPNRANIGYETVPFQAPVYRVTAGEAGLLKEKLGIFRVTQTHQVINVGDFCNECGNCTTFCPSAGSPYRDKPKFYLTRATLQQEDEGFAIEADTIYKRAGGKNVSLGEEEDCYTYASEQLKARIDKDSFEIVEVTFKQKETVAELTDVPEMAYLYQALKNVLGG